MSRDAIEHDAASLAALRDELRDRLARVFEAHERDLHVIRQALGHKHESSVAAICEEIERLRRIEMHANAIVEEQDVEPVEDLGQAMLRLMRSEARREVYRSAFELALLDGATREEAHEIANDASLREWPR